jgi:hypothetical protein
MIIIYKHMSLRCSAAVAKSVSLGWTARSEQKIKQAHLVSRLASYKSRTCGESIFFSLLSNYKA